MATHVDRGHIHNHFVWCAANVVTHKKYRSNRNTYHEIRNISDKLCKENELSVIVPQATKTYGKKYNQHFPEKASDSWRSKLKTAIDSLIPQAKDFNELLKLMEAQGYKVKRGKHISFQAEGQESFTRAKSLGEGYTEEAIRRKILEKPEPIAEEIIITEEQPPQKKAPPPIPQTPPITPPTITPPPTQTEKPEVIKPLIDIAGNPKFAEHRGLEQWAKLQNLKYTAEAFILMQEYGGMEAFMKLFNDCKTEVATYTNGIEANDNMIKAWGYLRKDIADYRRTQPIYKQYTDMKKAKNNITFFGKNRAEEFRNNNFVDIALHERMIEELKEYKRPLYNNATIDSEIEKIKAANVRCNKTLAVKKAELKQLSNIHSHLYYLQRQFEPPPPQREPKQQQRKRSSDFSL